MRWKSQWRYRNSHNQEHSLSINQFIQAGVAISLAAELVVKFPYGYLGRGEYCRLGEMTSPAGILPRKLDVYVEDGGIVLKSH